MGFFSRLFKKKPVEVPQAEVEDEYKIVQKMITLKEALEIDGWKTYKNIHVTQENHIVTARQFTIDDPIVDLETAKTSENSYVVLDKEREASIFDSKTFNESFKEI